MICAGTVSTVAAALTGRLATCAGLLTLSALTSAAAQPQPQPAQDSVEAPWTAVIEHSVVLSSSASKASARMEISALAWNPEAQELAAVSDRGVMYRYRLHMLEGRLHANALSSQRMTRSPPDAPNASSKLNAEALIWHPTTRRQSDPSPVNTTAGDGELLLAEEHGNAVLRLTPDGRVQGTLPWPPAVAAALSASVEDGSRHGVEAIAWHPRHGLLAALQRPVKSRPAVGQAEAAPLHWIHAASGARWGFSAAGPHSHLKAIESRPDGSLLLLERVRWRDDPRLHTVIRFLNPARCGEARLCSAPVLPIQPAPLIGTDNHEGLACTDSGTCWLVNDGGPKGEQPTRLIQFRLLAR